MSWHSSWRAVFPDQFGQLAHDGLHREQSEELAARGVHDGYRAAAPEELADAFQSGVSGWTTLAGGSITSASLTGSSSPRCLATFSSASTR
jgi:hypothetical protein